MTHGSFRLPDFLHAVPPPISTAITMRNSPDSSLGNSAANVRDSLSWFMFFVPFQK
jgi:hypothetical protein